MEELLKANSLAAQLILPGWCACGCGQPTALAARNRPEHGLLKGQPNRCLPCHHERKPDFRVEDGGCWIWAKSTDRTGYGQMHVGGQRRYAHREYFERANGPIEPGRHLHHLCNTPRCVRPDHLVPLTPKDHRRLSAKLSVEKVADIRSRYRAGERQVDLAREYGVAGPTIALAVRGETWV